MDLGMNLSFATNKEDSDILNTTIRDSETGSTVYTVETPNYAEGALTTTVTRCNQVNGSTRFAFRILWKGGKAALKDAVVVLDERTLEEVPVREVLESAPGSTTYGSVRINDVEYKWKSKGTGSKIVLVNKDTNEPPVAQSHSRIRGGFFRKRRDMSLEISAPVSQAVDVVLLTFILVWRERLAGKIKPTGDFPDMIPLSPLPVDV